MTKIARKTALVFGSSQVAAPANYIAEFGTKAAGVPAFSGDPAQIQTAEWINGWTSAVLAITGGVNQEALEDRNAVDFVASYQIAYLLNQGIPEWDSATSYNGTSVGGVSASICTYNGVIYQSKLDNNVNNIPASSPTAWSTLASVFASASQGTAKAWVFFNGATGAVYASFNVTNVAQLGTGNYLITFPGGLLPDAFYGYSLSCSNDNNWPYDPFTRFNGDTKTQTQLQVRNLNGNNLAGWAGNQENFVAIYR